MASRRRLVSRSTITTRSSSSKAAKHKSETHEHQELPTTTATHQETPSTISTTTNIQKQPCSPPPTEKAKDEDGYGCYNLSTPKAKRFRIPEIESCPPAPKKQRSSSSSSTNGVSNCSNLRRSSISFFTPPELSDQFFFTVSSVSNMSTAA